MVGQVKPLNRISILIIGLFFSHTAAAQQPQQSKPLQFEVAMIKPGKPNLGDYSTSSNGVSGGQLRLVNMPLKQWIEIGLGVQDYALKAPSWVEKAKFDLDARLPADKPADSKATAEMMKTLLVERFALRWHEESQNLSGYELVTDKTVLMKPSGLLERLRGNGSGAGPSFIQGTNMPISELAGALERILGRPVADSTRLAGGFDFKLNWRPSDDATAAEERRHGIDVDNLPSSVFEAVREQLGLRLQGAKVPSKVIVIDNIDPKPSEN